VWCNFTRFAISFLFFRFSFPSFFYFFAQAGALHLVVGQSGGGQSGAGQPARLRLTLLTGPGAGEGPEGGARGGRADGRPKRLPH